MASVFSPKVVDRALKSKIEIFDINHYCDIHIYRRRLTIWITRRVSYKKLELLIFPSLAPWFNLIVLVGSVLLIFLLFGFVLFVLLAFVLCLVSTIASVSGLFNSWLPIRASLTFILIYQGFRVYFLVPINWTAAGYNIYKCPRKK